MNNPPELFLYTKPGCSACDSFKSRLDEYGICCYPVDISGDAGLIHCYGARVPVLVAGNREICEGRFDPDLVLNYLRTLS